MTVKELREKLLTFPDDLEVMTKILIDIDNGDLDFLKKSHLDRVKKAIEEISTMSHWQSDDGQDLVMVADVLEAIKRNIGD